MATIDYSQWPDVTGLMMLLYHSRPGRGLRMRIVGDCSRNGSKLLLLLLAVLLLASPEVLAADVPLSPAEIYQQEVKALLEIAKRGPEAKSEEENVVRRARPSLLGIWLAPWVHHTLGQIAFEPEGHLDGLLKQILLRTNHIDRNVKSEGPEIVVGHGAVKRAPQLPAELEALSEQV